MTKKELLTEFSLFEDFESQAQAGRVYDHLINIISAQLTAGNSVALGQNFGDLRISTQAPRSGEINGVSYSTPSKPVAKFRPSASFKEAVAGN